MYPSKIKSLYVGKIICFVIQVPSQEPISGASDEPFVAVNRDSAYCVGCPTNLNTNVEGLSSFVDMAIDHVELENTQKHALLRVLNVQRQVCIKLICNGFNL